MSEYLHIVIRKYAIMVRGKNLFQVEFIKNLTRLIGALYQNFHFLRKNLTFPTSASADLPTQKLAFIIRSCLSLEVFTNGEFRISFMKF